MIRIEVIAETPEEAAEVVERLRGLRIAHRHVDPRRKRLTLAPRGEDAS